MYYLCNGFIYCPVGTRPAAANVASAKREGMKKLVCLFLLLPLLARAGGQTPEVTESDKKGSEFVSNIRVTLNATYEQACLTLDKFVRQYKYSLDSLFQWALRGMKLKSAQTLPVFIIADTFNRVVFVSQGYTIGLGEQLMRTVRGL